MIISFSILLKHFIFIWFEFVWKGITFSKFSKIFLIFAIQNFCKQFKETKLTIFNFFIRESFTQSASLWCRFLPTSTSDPKTSFAATTSSETQWGKAFLHTHTMILLWISRVKKVEMSKFGLHFETKKKLHIQFTVLLAKATICRGAKF